MYISSYLIKALAATTLCLAAPAPAELTGRDIAAFSTFSHNTVYKPLSQAPLWRTAYSRAIQVADQSLLLTWEDYPYGENSTNLDTFKVLRSTDGGVSWSNLSQVHDTQNGWGMRFRTSADLCIETTLANFILEPHMYITKKAYGSYPAGTLLIAGVSTPLSLQGGVYIDLYASSNSGASWAFVSHIARGNGPETVATGDQSIWEPFFLEYNDKLLIYFSDQRDSAHSQKLSLTTTTDLKSWSASADVVTYSDVNARPGMAVISYISTIKKYILTYEYCNNPLRGGCPAYFRLSSDPTAFLNAADNVLTTTTGYVPAGSPYSVYYAPNNAVIISTNSDTNVFVSKDNATTWISTDIGQWTGQSRNLLLFNDNGKTRLHSTTAGFYGCSDSCYNYVANGVNDPSTI